MEPVDIGSILLGHGQQIHSILARVNDRRTLDAELRVADTAALIALRNAGNSLRRIEKIHIPKRRSTGALVAVGIEGEHTVVHRNRVYDIVCRIRRRDENVWNIKRLGGLLSI